jgi:hypothetical protein
MTTGKDAWGVYAPEDWVIWKSRLFAYHGQAHYSLAVPFYVAFAGLLTCLEGVNTLSSVQCMEYTVFVNINKTYMPIF